MAAKDLEIDEGEDEGVAGEEGGEEEKGSGGDR